MSENKSQQELKAILTRYLNNQADAAEQQAVNSWYDAIGTAENTAVYEPGTKEKANLGKSIQRFLRNELRAEKRPVFKRFVVQLAAACLLVTGAGVYGYNYFLNHQVVKSSDVIITSNRGIQKNLTLPDGSEVLLNEESTLTIAKDFGKQFRKVTLVGEAFFKVAKDQHKPFLITSGNVKTRVVGTSFNISAYPDLEKIKISVMTGKVKILKTAQNTLLAQGLTKDQTFTFYKGTGNFEIKTEDTGLIASWRENKLYIDNATIAEIAVQLARYYHLEVKYNTEKNLQDRYTIRFNKESMSGVLQILSVLTKKKFTSSANQIIIN